MKDAAGELEAVLAEDLLLGQPFGVATEVAFDVRLAHLPPIGLQVLEADPTITDHDPGVGADQGLELLAVAVLGDRKEGRPRGAQSP